MTRTGYVDLDHWLDHDGGPDLDGPVLLTDEPSGDAMHWTPNATNPPGWPKPRPTRCPCPACTATKETR